MNIIEKILTFIITNEYFLKDFIEKNHIKLVYDSDFKRFINFIINYYKKYKDIPNSDEFQMYTKTEDNPETLWLWFEKYSNKSSIEGYDVLIDELRKEYSSKGFSHIVQSVDITKVDLKEIGYRFLKAANAVEEEEGIKKGFIYDDLDSRIERVENAKKYAGIPTGFQQLDMYLSAGGWSRKEMYLFFARMGVGKTRFMFSCAYNLAIQGYYGMFFSLEMYKEQIERIFDSRIGNISYNLLKKGNVDMTYYKDVIETIKNKKPPFYLEEITKDTTAELIEEQVVEFKKTNPLDFIVIDYLGCMEAKGFNNDSEKYRHIAKCLKNMAKREDIVLITAEQANRKARESEKENKEVDTENIAQSDWIGAYCDFIVYMKKNKLTPDILDMLILKNRDGEVYKKMRMSVDFPTNKIEDLDGAAKVQITDLPFMKNISPEDKI